MRALKRFAAFLCVGASATQATDLPAAELPLTDQVRPSVYLVEFGGYGVFEPSYEGSKNYLLSFKPIVEINKEGDRIWQFFPNDAIGYSLIETANFHAGPAGNVSLQSRFHNPDIDFRLGKADINVQGGLFAEYYPLENFRTRAEGLQGLTGNTGFALNLMADYIWKPSSDWTLTAGPRTQIVNDEYASEYFSTQHALRTKQFVKFRAEGGVLSAGGEFSGAYYWTGGLTTRFFVDYSKLTGDAADSPRVDIKGSADQVTVGIGASYQIKVER
jgi:outer membrane scaffolding protein for murein synthesis (MipA/OmpV family)